ncbi:bifunctional 3-(3-hydroxy-phenyl)propionate/3-hydroxycinnamic acid hydroxylase [Microbacterium sp. ARD31]|uniref:bifunctional 3-(3-hydroxy-phenyl)propionate/3-hydroxycinnamic acid hydroxylase MhpA n=1 Tax=Microbacterium sp. ARD31 TaxID=2962576 RepID=UPI002880DCF1|nr:bifunctional 3-(3-hydroxy-phenyl)propionate/3-hydroxycinnamic acid hydroxylase [Microbacterium sp. ARD31]MDT0183956.1 bifunctional 3-(3-hydroxy-phenyl)propionate/3-hydroxycinnamic acid hydroxylase [Microbacterium sp. ARD31]
MYVPPGGTRIVHSQWCNRFDIVQPRPLSSRSPEKVTKESPMPSADVIVVGYGPTGMTLAALLGLQGRRVVVLERYDELYNLPRAAAFDDETMRTFQKLGIAEKLLPGTNVQAGYVWTNGGGEVLLDIEYDNPGRNGWPAQYMMYQPHLESTLDELISSMPSVEVIHGAAVTAITEDAEGVIATAHRADGSSFEVASRFLVGADGGNGFVRTHLGSSWDDYGFSENWLVCDFALRHEVRGLPTFQQVCNPHGPIAIVNIGPGHHRFSFRLESGQTREEVTDPAYVWSKVAAFLRREQADLIRVANYTFSSLIVDRWRRGRIALAGDAAHQMPPFLAQGMVSGIRDARNLAWKLGMVLDGAPDDLLDTYQPEREPHVRFITERAVELGRVQTERDVERAAARDARMIAARRANAKPDKLIYPGLTGGMIDNHGALLPQGLVSTARGTALFDDLAGTGWLIVASEQAALAAVHPEALDAFHRLGGNEAVFAITSMFAPAEYSDTAGSFTRFFRQTGAIAALVRPDSYIYGLAHSPQELADLVESALTTLDIEDWNGVQTR